MKKIYAFCLAFLAFTAFSGAQTVIPQSDELILPQYAYYGGTSSAHRMPFVCRLKLTGLTPGATYRYFTGMSSNGSAAVQTPGSMYRINNGQNATYGYIIGYAANKAINSSEIQNDEMKTGFTSADSRHGRFTADGGGNYTGWFACVPVNGATSGVPVQTIGSDVYFYVQINDGGTGTTLAKSFRTTSTVKLLNYSAVAGEANGCTPLIGTSDVGDEKMVAIYDNTAATGRPLYCTFTENNNQGGGALNEGTIWTNPAIYAAVDGKSGSWAAIIPNTLTGGVKAINFLNINDASLVTLSNSPAPNTSADGVWNGVSTANPAGDSTKAIVINSIAGNGPLPVKLLSFDGKMAKDGIQLVWTTTQETKNKHFEIMRAGTNGQFSAIGKVNAVSVPALTNHYEFLDSRPLNGKNVYRLKQVDEDGASTLTKVITIDNNPKGQNKMRVVSQSTNELVVSITSGTATAGRLVYSDASGRVLYAKQITLAAGDNSLSIPVAQSALQLGVVTFSPIKGDMMQLKLIR